jgi:hypothetical protein
MLRIQLGRSTPATSRMAISPMPSVVTQVMTREKRIRLPRGGETVRLISTLHHLTHYLIIVLR